MKFKFYLLIFLFAFVSLVKAQTIVSPPLSARAGDRVSFRLDKSFANPYDKISIIFYKSGPDASFTTVSANYETSTQVSVIIPPSLSGSIYSVYIKNSSASTHNVTSPPIKVLIKGLPPGSVIASVPAPEPAAPPVVKSPPPLAITKEVTPSVPPTPKNVVSTPVVEAPLPTLQVVSHPEVIQAVPTPVVTPPPSPAKTTAIDTVPAAIKPVAPVAINQTITFTAPQDLKVGAATPLIANATSNGPITYILVSGNAVLSGSTLTALDTKPIVIEVRQSGSSNFSKASTTVTLVATAAPQKVTFYNLPSLKVGVPASITASATSNGPITYTLISGNATLKGSTLTALDTKPIIIQASQAGSNIYSEAFVATTLIASLEKISIERQPESATVVSGSEVTFDVSASGTSPTYQWFVNKKSISGATSSSYTLASAVESDAGTYTCTVSNSESSKTTLPAKLTITPAVVITSQPSSAVSIKAGESTTLTVAAIGKALTYQWSLGSHPIEGATSSSYTINAATVSNEGSYTCYVSNASGNATSTATVVTVLPVKQTVTFNTLPTLTVGVPATLSASASSNGPIRYSIVSGNAKLDGAEITALDDKPVTIQATQPGYNSFLESSTTTTLTALLEPVTLVREPSSLTLVSGSQVTLSVIAAGTLPSYQWLFNNKPIEGATSSSYTIDTATETNAGDYTCTVSNKISSKTTAAATLTLTPSVIITIQPTAALSVKAGLPATFLVAATGKDLSYQWYNGSHAIEKATTSSYTISSVTTANEGSYTCTITNKAGSATSTASILTVLPAEQTVTFNPLTQLVVGVPATVSAQASSKGPITYSLVSGNAALTGDSLTAYDTKPIVILAIQMGSSNYLEGSAKATFTASLENIAITRQPDSASVVSGNPVTFTVTATGTSPNYQWFFNATPISGENLSYLTLKAATSSNEGTYTCTVSNEASSKKSAEAKLTITKASQTITFDKVPEITVGQAVSLSASASSHGPVTYSIVSGNANLIGSSFTALDNKPVVVQASQSGSNDFLAGSTTISLKASLENISITNEPASLAIISGGSATFTVAASGTSPSYQWLYNDTPIPNATSSSYTITAATTSNAGNYTCSVSNAISSKTSAPATLRVTPAQQFVAFDKVPDLKVDVPTVLSATSTSSGPITYALISGNATLSGATLTALDTKPIVIQATQAGTNNYLEGSFKITLTASLEAIAITQQPDAVTIQSGNVATFTVAATGTKPTYQWSFNDTPIKNANAPTYTLKSATTENAGAYTCTVSNATSSKTTAPATLTVTLSDQRLIFDKPSDLKVGTATELTARASSNGPITFTLVSGNASLKGSTLTALDTKPIVVKASQVGSKEYEPVSQELTLNATFENITITHQPESVSIVSGSPASFEVAVLGTAPTYQWLFNDTAIPGATSSSFTIKSVTLENAGNYKCTISNSIGSKNSTLANLTVLPGQQTVTFNKMPEMKVGVASQLSASATSNGPITYSVIAGNATLSGDKLTALDTKPIVVQASQAGTSNYTASSTTATLSASLEDIVITQQPESVSVVNGEPASFEVKATGSTPSYQWLFNDTPIVGAISETYALSASTAANAGTYKCTVSNGASSKTSLPAILKLTPAVLITAQPEANTTVKVGMATKLTVTAAGKELNYQWSLGGTPIEGANSPIYTIAFATSANEGSYTCVVSNSSGSASTAPAFVTVLAPPTITTPPASAAVSLNTSTKFFIKAAGTNLTYQWYFNDTAIIGANTDTYTIGSVAPADIGSYTCSVTNDVGTTMSTAAKLSLNSTHIQNLSIRTVVGSSNLVVGFGTAGTGPKSLAMRCNVPSVIRTLSSGSGALAASPTLILYSNPAMTAESSIALAEDAALSNDTKQVASFPLTASSSNTIPLQNFLPGTYSAVLSGSTNTSESAMLEIYDSDTGNSPSRIGKFSALGLVSIGSPVVSCGFVVIGDTTETLLIRAVGPSLSSYGVNGVLAQPSLTVYDSSINPIASNTVWDGGHKLSNAMAQVGAFNLPTDSADSAVLVKVSAGAYTVQVSGVGGSIGNVLLEVYEVSSP